MQNYTEVINFLAEHILPDARIDFQTEANDSTMFDVVLENNSGISEVLTIQLQKYGMKIQMASDVLPPKKLEKVLADLEYMLEQSTGHNYDVTTEYDAGKLLVNIEQ